MRHALVARLVPTLLALHLGGPLFAEEQKAAPPAPPPLDATTRDYHQIHMDIRVRPDLAARAVEGSVTHRFVSIVPGLQVLRFHCQETEVRRVLSADGAVLPHEVKDGVLSIRLPAPMADGAEGTVTVEYRSTPTRGLFFHSPTDKDPTTPWMMYSQGQGNDNRRWIPCYDEPDDRCTWEVRARVEEKFTTVSNGTKVGAEAHGDGTRTDHWSFDQRSATYLVSLIVGVFETISFESDGVLVEYNGPPGRRAELEAALGDTPEMIRFFGEYAGRYPFKRYAQTYVWDFVYGGMENTTATTLNLRALHGLEVLPNYTSRPLVSHELAHMWFGDLLTCHTWNHIWLNEGFATYFTDLWYEHSEGQDAFLLRRRDQNRRYLSDTPRPEDLGLSKAPRGDLPLELHGGKQYSRGAAILHMLRREIGDDVFRRAIQRYVAQFRDSCVTSEALRRIVEETAGRDLKWFFDQWVYGAGYPVLEVTRDGDRVTDRQVQARRGGQDLFRIGVPARLGADGAVEVLRLTRERNTFTLAPGQGDWLRFGIGGDLLMTVRLEQPMAAWVGQLAGDPDVTGRLDAVEALEEFGVDAVEALSRAAASDAAWSVRQKAVEVLGRIDEAGTTAGILPAAKDADARVRETAMAALGKKSRAEAGPTLAAACASEAHPYVRAEAARSLGRVKAEGAFETLKGLLAVDSHENVVRKGAIEGLRHLGQPDGAALAIPLLDYEVGLGGTHGVRQVALDTLTALWPDGRRTKALLRELLDDPYHHMRSWAAEACGKYGATGAIDRLREMAQKDWNEGVRNNAKTALERLGVKEPAK
jgi:aminopeptidase N